MRIRAFLLATQFWCYSVTALSFGNDFNGTIPSILGITNFSYPAASSNIGFGYADGVVNTDYHQPWPLVKMYKSSVHLIRYCYADQASKDALHCSWPAAENLWQDALGGKPSKETGYNLHFVQAWAAGETQFCYAEGTYDPKTAQGTWNWKLHNRQDALVVAYRPVDEKGNKPATSASLGYTPESALFPWQSRQARHYIQISDKDDEVRIAHELGHVLGLLHEHQRSDRDTVIEYRPENIAGYTEALAAAIKDKVPEAEARQKLRDDVPFCQKYNFRGSAYVKNADQPGPIIGDHAQGPLDFDFDSIMIYPSDAQTDTAACRADLAHCPIVRRAGTSSDGKSKFEYIAAKGKPSAKDVEFVRKHYAWREEEVSQRRKRSSREVGEVKVQIKIRRSNSEVQRGMGG
ncbi:uncharacterized protein CC84DRAFT_1175361 [Paraphaeosphaeria sporulosa]|uniref:Peptidase M12A domain-containing protein n=1 Tax=Paraphaeosphaeria sporulosa TaxID=1460663 RepID=A0A177CK06_9PLEO|nr:uncharacterized protein CC84DRAFT_1175361 [Paraphaeosphaeria sporulosa]OAG07581.1 hypothetical protein CC84DRAFT_1175361 [Paraphaeosphaeria sporulosa]